MTFANNLLPEHERVSRRPKVDWVRLCALISLPLVLWMGAYNILLGKNIEIMKTRLDTVISQSNQLTYTSEELSSLQKQRQDLVGTLSVLGELMTNGQTLTFDEMKQLLLQIPQTRHAGVWIRTVSFFPERLLIAGMSSDFESAMSFGQSIGSVFGGFEVSLGEIEEYRVGEQVFYQFQYDLGYGG